MVENPGGPWPTAPLLPAADVHEVKSSLFYCNIQNA